MADTLDGKVLPKYDATGNVDEALAKNNRVILAIIEEELTRPVGTRLTDELYAAIRRYIGMPDAAETISDGFRDGLLEAVTPAEKESEKIKRLLELCEVEDGKVN